MKAAITALGELLDSQVDQRFGRAAKFIVCDSESDAVEVVDNKCNLEAAQGAGIQSAQTVSKLGVEYVLTGHCGPKAFRTLRAAGIQVITGVSGTVGEVLEKFKRGELKPAGDADVDGHWV